MDKDKTSKDIKSLSDAFLVRFTAILAVDTEEYAIKTAIVTLSSLLITFIDELDERDQEYATNNIFEIIKKRVKDLKGNGKE